MNIIRRIILKKSAKTDPEPDLAGDRDRIAARNARLVSEVMETQRWTPVVAFEAGSLSVARVDLSAKFGLRGHLIRAEVTPGDLRVRVYPEGVEAPGKEIHFGYEQRAALLRKLSEDAEAVPGQSIRHANPVRKLLAEARLSAVSAFLGAQADRAQMIADIPNGPKTSRPEM